MKFARQILRLRWLALATIFAIASPQTVSAHGELLIQIAAVTRKIETATNHVAQLYLQRGELHREHKDWDAAKSDYDRASQLDSKLTAIDFCRAKMLDDSGELEAARAMFDKVVVRNPKDGEAFIGRARVVVRLGQSKAAIADFQRGLELLTEPKPEYFMELAQTFVSEKKTADALRTLDQGIKKFGPIVTLQGYALDRELERENYDAALARIGTIIKDAPRKENWLARRGDILLAMGRPAEARQSFAESLGAIKILPSILQKAPPMQTLQARVNASLAGITHAPASFASQRKK